MGPNQLVFAEEHRYLNSNTHLFEFPTAYTPTMIAAATKIVEQMYRSDFAYKKAGIMLVDLSPMHTTQLALFVPTDEIPKQTHAMQAVDAVNNKWGSRTAFFAASGVDQHGNQTACCVRNDILRNGMNC